MTSLFTPNINFLTPISTSTWTTDTLNTNVTTSYIPNNIPDTDDDDILFSP